MAQPFRAASLIVPVCLLALAYISMRAPKILLVVWPNCNGHQDCRNASAGKAANRRFCAKGTCQECAATKDCPAQYRCTSQHCWPDLQKVPLTPPLAAALCKRLQSTSQETRALAAKLLLAHTNKHQQWADVACVERLGHLLRRSDTKMRQSAISLIMRLGKRRGVAIPALVDALFDRQPEIRKQAEWALATIGPQMLQSIIKACHQKDYGRRKGSAARMVPLFRLLRNLGAQAKAALPVMEVLLQKGSVETQVAVLDTLQAIGVRRETNAYLRMMMWEKDARLRHKALQVAASYVPVTMPLLPDLLFLLKHNREAQSHHLAIQCLGAMGPKAKEMTPYLLQILKRVWLVPHDKIKWPRKPTRPFAYFSLSAHRMLAQTAMAALYPMKEADKLHAWVGAIAAILKQRQHLRQLLAAYRTKAASQPAQAMSLIAFARSQAATLQLQPQALAMVLRSAMDGSLSSRLAIIKGVLQKQAPAFFRQVQGQLHWP